MPLDLILLAASGISEFHLKGGEHHETFYDPQSSSLQRRMPITVLGKTLNCPSYGESLTNGRAQLLILLVCSWENKDVKYE